MLRGAGSGPNLAAEAAWRLYVQQTLGTVDTGVEPWRCSELMILYIGTRGSYSLEHELTVTTASPTLATMHQAATRPPSGHLIWFHPKPSTQVRRLIGLTFLAGSTRGANHAGGQPLK